MQAESMKRMINAIREVGKHSADRHRQRPREIDFGEYFRNLATGDCSDHFVKGRFLRIQSVFGVEIPRTLGRIPVG